MSFDLSTYEGVNDRIIRFRKEFPTGRLEVHILDMNLQAGMILIEARAYRNYEDDKPSAIDMAFGLQSTFNLNMKKFYIEDTATSAIGRVIGMLTPSPVGRPTRQDMEKVEQTYTEPVADPYAKAKEMGITNYEYDQMAKSWSEEPFVGVSIGSAIEAIQESLGDEMAGVSPKCKHGHRLLMEGISTKTGRPYRGYKCMEKLKEKQCEMIWYRILDSGEWLPPKDYVEYTEKKR